MREAHAEMRKYYEEKRQRLAQGCEKCGSVSENPSASPPSSNRPLAVFDVPVSVASNLAPDSQEFTSVIGPNGESFLIQSELLKK